VVDWKKRLGDVVGEVGARAKAAGNKLEEVADKGLGAVGIGLGSMTLRVDGNGHRLGDTLTGTLTLKLEQPVEAQSLSVTLLNRPRRSLPGCRLR
jgi:hypothetical protein